MTTKIYAYTHGSDLHPRDHWATLQRNLRRIRTANLPTRGRIGKTMIELINQAHDMTVRISVP